MTLIKQPLYPEIEKGIKTYILPRWVLYLAILVLLILLLKTCFQHSQTVAPIVQTVEHQKEVIRTDSVASKRYTDSVKQIINDANEQVNQANKDLADLSNLFNDWKGHTDSLEQQPIPDTCQQIVSKYKKSLDNLYNIQQQKDDACSRGIMAKNLIISQKDVLIAKGEFDKKQLLKHIDTCLNNQTALQKYIKQIKPKSEVYAGIDIIGSQVKPVAAYGVDLGLKTKNGQYFQVGAFQMGANIYYQASYKRTIFKF